MESSITLYEPSMSEVSFEINERSQERVQDRYREIISVKDSAFPSEHIAWLRGFERSPNTPLRQTYIQGIVQPEVDPNAPTIRIGIIFLEGADKPAVARAEMNRETREKLDQKTPEWRVATAATLLRRFETDDDLSISQPDDSPRILEKYKSNETERRRSQLSPTYSEYEPTKPSSKRQTSGSETFQAIVKRNIQEHPLTIDSDSVHLIHGDRASPHEYDIMCTLIEVDLQSICALLANFREIISSGIRNVSTRDIAMILDTMINDVRRLCTRSPTLFRMATRSIIAKSKNTRYGVSYGTVFATMTTSTGIRVFIERSVAYYTSLNDSKMDQETVRPKFLQMLVMLLSLLNDEDLQQISSILENTFKMPGNRQGLELLILKVLPLSSFNSKVFVEDLLAATDIGAKKVQLMDRSMQRNSWRELQTQLARDGYLVPVHIQHTGISEEPVAENLEDMMNAMRMPSQQPTGFPSDIYGTARNYNARELSFQNPRSWLAAWPEDTGIFDSTIFKHLQHCGKTRSQGSLQDDIVKAVNVVPHLDITSEDKENEYVAVFANGARYRVSSHDPEYISKMQSGKYTLKEEHGNSIVDLDIVEEVLNQPFTEAAKQHNELVDQINLFTGGRRERKRLSLRRSTSAKFTKIEEPVSATRVWAEIVQPSGTKVRVAEAFKLGDRIVFREDIVNSMNATLSRLTRNTERFELAVPQYQIKDSDRDVAMMQQAHVTKLMEALDIIKTITFDANRKRAELVQLRGPLLPTDPISTVIYTSFIQTSGEKPEWQNYGSALHSDNERMIVQSKRLVVDEVHQGNIIKLEFHSAHLILSIQALGTTAPAAQDEDDDFFIKRGDTVLWMGYYIVHVDPVPDADLPSFEVLAYYRVLSQKRSQRRMRGAQSAAEKLQGSFLI
jgi:hypothetical protein